MAEVKWIKLCVDFFNNKKIRYIETLPHYESILLIWIRLLCLAGSINDDGFIYVTKDIPLDSQLLAIQFNESKEIVDAALNTFEELGMIYKAGNFYCIKNWEKYQNIAGLEHIKEINRQRSQRYRNRKKYGSTCAYCGDFADTLDHIIPISKYGNDDDLNLVASCKSCNSAKGNKNLIDFLNDDIKSTTSRLDHELIQSNEKLMRKLAFDDVAQVYFYSATFPLRDAHALEQEQDKNKNKNKNIVCLSKNQNFSIRDLITDTEYDALDAEVADIEALLYYVDGYIKEPPKHPYEYLLAVAKRQKFLKEDI